MKKIILFLYILLNSCATITPAIAPLTTQEEAGLSLTYIKDWQKLYINATKIRGNNCTVTIFDINKTLVYQNITKTNPPFFTTEINCSAMVNGTFILNLSTEFETVTAKFDKQ